MPEIHDLAAPYSLDALDAPERAAYERHLESCAACRREIARLRDAASFLAVASETVPPARLKAAVLDAVDERASAERRPRGARYRRVPLRSLAIAALVVAVVSTGALLLRNGAVTPDDIASAPDAATVALVGDGIEASFTFSLEKGAGVFTSATLPAVGAGETYQLWLIDDTGPAPAGLFAPGDDGMSEVVVGDVRPGVVIGLTVEPAGGSPAPTGDVLLAAEVG